MARPKKPRGRPPKHKKPVPIPDELGNITRSLLRTRSKEEREMLAEQGEEAATKPLPPDTRRPTAPPPP